MDVDLDPSVDKRSNKVESHTSPHSLITGRLTLRQCRRFKANIAEMGILIQISNPLVLCLQETYLTDENISFFSENTYICNKINSVTENNGSGINISILIYWYINIKVSILILIYQYWYQYINIDISISRYQDQWIIVVNKSIPHKEITLSTKLQAVSIWASIPKTITICSIYLPPNLHWETKHPDE